MKIPFKLSKVLQKSQEILMMHSLIKAYQKNSMLKFPNKLQKYQVDSVCMTIVSIQFLKEPETVFTTDQD